MNIEVSRDFIYKNARPLDIARWKYLFENGSWEDVLTALASYQNDDGGFGHALEPDCWNPNSSPVQTWVATEIIKEIDLRDKSHPMVRKILRYLLETNDFDGHIWANSIPSNNAYPHAEWWEYNPNAELSYNPTAALLGFIIKFSDTDNPLYSTACALIREAYDYFKREYPLDSIHSVSCFVELYDYLSESSVSGILDMDEFRSLLKEQIAHVITMDTTVWKTEYVCKPSLFIHSRSSEFYSGNESLCKYECGFISNSQNSDGTWDITWNWADYLEQWNISKSWWKSDLIIKNLLFIRAMENKQE